MKNKFLILALSSFTLISAHAGVVAAQTESAVFELPALVVESPRYLAAEKNIEASLGELREQAEAPAMTCVELTALRPDSRSVAPRQDLLTAQQSPVATKIAKS